MNYINSFFYHPKSMLPPPKEINYTFAISILLMVIIIIAFIAVCVIYIPDPWDGLTEE